MVFESTGRFSHGEECQRKINNILIILSSKVIGKVGKVLIDGGFKKDPNADGHCRNPQNKHVSMLKYGFMFFIIGVLLNDPATALLS